MGKEIPSLGFSLVGLQAQELSWQIIANLALETIQFFKWLVECSM